MRRTRRIALGIAVAALSAGGSLAAAGGPAATSADPMCERAALSGDVNYGTGTCPNAPTPVFCQSQDSGVNGVEDVYAEECVPV